MTEPLEISVEKSSAEVEVKLVFSERLAVEDLKPFYSYDGPVFKALQEQGWIAQDGTNLRGFQGQCSRRKLPNGTYEVSFYFC